MFQSAQKQWHVSTYSASKRTIEDVFMTFSPNIIVKHTYKLHGSSGVIVRCTTLGKIWGGTWTYLRKSHLSEKDHLAVFSQPNALVHCLPVSLYELESTITINSPSFRINSTYYLVTLYAAKGGHVFFNHSNFLPSIYIYCHKTSENSCDA